MKKNPFGTFKCGTYIKTIRFPWKKRKYYKKDNLRLLRIYRAFEKYRGKKKRRG